MKMDDLSEKQISVNKCTLYITSIPGIYNINHVAKVAAIAPNIILTGEFISNIHNSLAFLEKNLLETEVALIKEYVFGNAIAYKVLNLATISLPIHMGGERKSIWPKFH
ncbi:MAG: hypothetical protein PVI90_03480 [Desulfobacteraceae bacterium]